MGGEQIAVLIYGPKVMHSYQQWVTQYKMIDKKSYVQKFLEKLKNETGNLPDRYKDFDLDNVHDVDNIFWEIEDNVLYRDSYDILTNILSGYEMRAHMHEDNMNWDETYVGCVVKDYNTFDPIAKQRVDDFCMKYGMNAPTFFGGIVGEYE